jgi:3-oxoacyl-[acyl-carrier-protein] synthase-1
MSALSMTPLRVAAYSLVSALGVGRSATLHGLAARSSGLARNDFTTAPLETCIGRVHGLESLVLPEELAAWDCRNNRLAYQALHADEFAAAVAAARNRAGAARVAVFVGTSTSSIGASEEAYRRLEPGGRYPEDLRRPQIHTPHSLGAFVQQALELDGIAVTVATACSSSAKVFCQAERMIRAGIVDAAVVGGVDTLCDSVLFGFNSLELVAAEPCRPFDVARAGISIGEAGGFALLVADDDGAGPWLVGYGESSDAYHMSSPHPDGTGIRIAIRNALERAGLTPAQVDYLNLHGTGTLRNDEIEARVVAEMFPAQLHASATKGWTGHTLGAAGIVEAVITLLALESKLMPGTLNTLRPDPECGGRLAIHNRKGAARAALTQSFGFGGNNCVLAFARDRSHR